MTVLDTARAFLEKAKSLNYKDVQEALDKLPREVWQTYYKLQKDAFFAPENAVEERRTTYTSPSGKYILTVTPFSTTKGGWNYTQGIVAAADGSPIEEVRRNYSHFPFLFVEGHPNGHDYLICGEDYQGQTVIELDTGKRRELLPKEAKKGHGFCWASYEYHEPSQMLMVNGCFWACPYEFRFYDFSDPMNGWPELDIIVNGEQSYIESDERKPEIEGDKIKCFQINDDDEDYDWDDDAKPEDQPIASYRVFQRQGNQLVMVEEWVSDNEKIRRAEQEENRRKYEEWEKTFKAEDPLYLTYLKRVQDPKLSPDKYSGRGITYENWCPHWKGEETRWCRRIVTNKKPYTIDLEWAVKTGPIKLNIYKDGKRHEEKFFDEHSVDSMNAAFDYALELLA